MEVVEAQSPQKLWKMRKRWKELVEEDFKLKDLIVDSAQDGVKWKKLVTTSDPT